MEGDEKRREEIHSVSIRAGKRTYFFDVKETRQNDYYLTITESKKVFDKDGNSRFEKHKIFLYKEDNKKFLEALSGVISFVDTGIEPVFEEDTFENDFKTDILDDFSFDLKD
ncbi:MAG: PUR family DNA/RNA-binding protein [Bacilli bacterium]|nr:PUR family DNA/RNA-binding protein [Bacilli bacterium]